DRALASRAGPGEAHVADQLLPDELLHVVVDLDAKARIRPDLRDPADPLCRRAAPLTEPHELPAAVVNVPGPDDRGPEAAGDADRDPLLPEDRGDPVGAAEAVLDRQHDGLWAEQRLCCRSGGLDVVRLRRDHDEVANAHFGRIAGRMDVHRSIPARTFNRQAARPDRIHVVGPDVDGPDLVTGVAEDSGVDGSHSTGADDRDPHRSITSPIIEDVSVSPRPSGKLIP